MNVIFLKAEWTRPNVTSFEMGIRYNGQLTNNYKLKNICIYEVIDEQLFFLNVIEHSIEFEVV
jgi:hypothetical protein